MLRYWTVKKGNKSVRKMEILDKAGKTVENLADATDIIFQIKKNKTDAAALVEKTKGAGIEVNPPDPGPGIGYLRITLDPDDTETALSVGDYFMALEIEWTPTDIYEVNVRIDGIKTERLRVRQDIIRRT